MNRRINSRAKRGPLSASQWAKLRDSSSRLWGPGKAPGDGQESARGTVGTDAAATPIGSARVLIAWVSFFLALLCVVLAALVGVANGLLLLATIFAATFAWSVGFFNRAYWR